VRILLIENDEPFARVLTQALTGQHYLVDLANDGQMGWELAEVFAYDLILLDAMLPKLDGISFCQKLRQNSKNTPVILLTTQEQSTNKITGLDALSYDYIIKPFEPEKLLGRIRALLRRGTEIKTKLMQWGDLCLNAGSCEVRYQGNLLPLTAKEYGLIELFLRHPRRIFSSSGLLDRLWSFDERSTENAVRAQIKSLRQKLKKAGGINLIETVYGLGYRLKSQDLSTNKELTVTLSPVTIVDAESTTVEQAKQLTDNGISAIWERHKDKYYQRVTIIEQAISDLRKDALTEELKQQAIREAHTLAGSLGSFGFEQASKLAREIETTWKNQAELTKIQLDTLGKIVVELRQEITQPPPPKKLTYFQNSVAKQAAKILIVDDDRVLALSLKQEAKNQGMEAIIVDNLPMARSSITSIKPDVVLLDLCFPNTEETGLELLEELANKEPNLPILVLTAEESFSQRVKVARLGGKGFLQKPVSPAQVMEAICQILNPPTTPEAKLLIVDDDAQVLDILRNLLSPWGFKMTLLEEPKNFWETLEKTHPDLLILDIEMPDYTGIELCQVVRNDDRWSDLPVLFLSSHTDSETIEKVFTVGADDYVNKPVVGPELINRILNRIERSRILRQLAEVDGLTGLTNRRKSTQEISRFLNLAERQKQPFCLGILDLDYFKYVNDQYGHNIGDKVLSFIGKLLKESFRSEDVVARWGGEEFVIGLYGTNRNQGVQRITKLLTMLQNQEFTNNDRGTFRVSFSAGVAEYPKNGRDLQTLYRAADSALYQAKAMGRSRVLPAR